MSSNNSNLGRRLGGVAANELDCDVVVSEFELQMRSSVLFRTNTPCKRYEQPYPAAMNLIVPLLFFNKYGFDMK